MVFPKNNEWGSEYWLERFLEGKQTILEPVTDDKNIEFPTGSMVIKGEYLTLAAQQKMKREFLPYRTNMGEIFGQFLKLAHSQRSCSILSAVIYWGILMRWN